MKKRNSTINNQKGFTLIEIAIVLVIIGLLIGGALKGQALIQSAKVKRVAKQADEYRVAVMTYYDKYQRFPGDDDQASSHPGDGDGLMEANAERFALFGHMASAKLISGSFNGTSETPTHAFGGALYGIYWVNPNPSGSTPSDAPLDHYLRFDNLPWDVAMELDMKYDDGVWNTGSVVANEDYIEASSPVSNFYMPL